MGQAAAHEQPADCYRTHTDRADCRAAGGQGENTRSRPRRAGPRRWSRRSRNSSSPAASTGIPSSRTPTPAAGSRWAPAMRSTSAPTTPSMSAAASPSAPTSASRRSTARHACSIAAACCRCSADGARPPTSGSTASARRTRRSTIARTTASGNPTWRRISRCGLVAAPAGGRWTGGLAVGSGIGQGLGAVGGGGLYAGHVAGVGRQADLPATERDARLRLAPGRRLRPAGRLLRRHDHGAMRIRTAPTASARSTTRPSSTSRF